MRLGRGIARHYFTGRVACLKLLLHCICAMDEPMKGKRMRRSESLLGALRSQAVWSELSLGLSERGCQMPSVCHFPSDPTFFAALSWAWLTKRVTRCRNV